MYDFAMSMILSQFQSIRPPYETKQAIGLEWMADAHAEAEKNSDPAFREAILAKILHVGCKPEQIEKRGHVITDYLHRDWEKMEVFRLKETPTGLDLSTRSKIFESHVDRIFEEYYPDKSLPPQDLIHVSCTGYVSPSGAQKIASKRKWGRNTTVTHAYHMGCYGSIPALRMAVGFLSSHTKKEKADIVHTELCSLHMNPANHNLDQLVVQSLFADGFIKYSVLKKSNGPHLRIISILEDIIPDSSDAMTWVVSSANFQMTLAKEIPVLIARALPGFYEELKSQTDAIPLKEPIFAIHPGGPKIVSQIQKLFKLSDDQVRHSLSILKNYGNMSSATLPHIWESILNDPKVPFETPIVSFAFGPGLSIAGAFLVKTCGN